MNFLIPYKKDRKLVLAMWVGALLVVAVGGLSALFVSQQSIKAQGEIFGPVTNGYSNNKITGVSTDYNPQTDTRLPNANTLREQDLHVSLDFRDTISAGSGLLTKQISDLIDRGYIKNAHFQGSNNDTDITTNITPGEGLTLADGNESFVVQLPSALNVAVGNIELLAKGLTSDVLGSDTYDANDFYATADESDHEADASNLGLFKGGQVFHLGNFPAKKAGEDTAVRACNDESSFSMNMSLWPNKDTPSSTIVSGLGSDLYKDNLVLSGTYGFYDESHGPDLDNNNSLGETITSRDRNAKVKWPRADFPAQYSNGTFTAVGGDNTDWDPTHWYKLRVSWNQFGGVMQVIDIGDDIQTLNSTSGVAEPVSGTVKATRSFYIRDGLDTTKQNMFFVLGRGFKYANELDGNIVNKLGAHQGAETAKLFESGNGGMASNSGTGLTVATLKLSLLTDNVSDDYTSSYPACRVASENVSSPEDSSAALALNQSGVPLDHQGCFNPAQLYRGADFSSAMKGEDVGSPSTSGGFPSGAISYADTRPDDSSVTFSGSPTAADVALGRVNESALLTQSFATGQGSEVNLGPAYPPAEEMERPFFNQDDIGSFSDNTKQTKGKISGGFKTVKVQKIPDLTAGRSSVERQASAKQPDPSLEMRLERASFGISGGGMQVNVIPQYFITQPNNLMLAYYFNNTFYNSVLAGGKPMTALSTITGDSYAYQELDRRYSPTGGDYLTFRDQTPRTVCTPVTRQVPAYEHDQDADGMSDEWEARYCKATANSNVPDTADADVWNRTLSVGDCRPLDDLDDDGGENGAGLAFSLISKHDPEGNIEDLITGPLTNFPALASVQKDGSVIDYYSLGTGRLTNIMEYILGTSPINSDTDGDGIVDGMDVLGLGTNNLQLTIPETQIGLDKNVKDQVLVSAVGVSMQYGTSIVAAQDLIDASAGAINPLLTVSPSASIQASPSQIYDANGNLQLGDITADNLSGTTDPKIVTIAATISDSDVNAGSLNYVWTFVPKGGQENAPSLVWAAKTKPDDPYHAEGVGLNEVQVALPEHASLEVGDAFIVMLTVVDDATGRSGEATTTITNALHLNVNTYCDINGDGLYGFDSNGASVEAETTNARCVYSGSKVQVMLDALDSGVNVSDPDAGIVFQWSLDNVNSAIASGVGKNAYTFTVEKQVGESYTLSYTITDSKAGKTLVDSQFVTLNVLGPAVAVYALPHAATDAPIETDGIVGYGVGANISFEAQPIRFNDLPENLVITWERDGQVLISGQYCDVSVSSANSGFECDGVATLDNSVLTLPSGQGAIGTHNIKLTIDDGSLDASGNAQAAVSGFGEGGIRQNLATAAFTVIIDPSPAQTTSLLGRVPLIGALIQNIPGVAHDIMTFMTYAAIAFVIILVVMHFSNNEFSLTDVYKKRK